MPELPDIVVYQEALERRIVGQPLERIDIFSPFLLRTFDPPVEACVGKTVRQIVRLGKRIAIGCEDDFFLILHLMIAGRLHWKPADQLKPGASKLKSKTDLAAFTFPNGRLTLTEAGSKRRASLSVVRGEKALREHDPGGLDVFAMTVAEFRQQLIQENHTIKRSLTDPHLFSGIGNAYSDEILHAARMSPLLQTKKMTDDDFTRLHQAIRETLQLWTDRLRAESVEKFPERVTAFRPEMAVHGKFGKPCPVCQSPVQRIQYADNETNYCAKCQTGGKVLADRSLSRLLKDDWLRSIDEWS
ncbi:formamidopyrimidine-DNA glycosylase [bacterium]|nr:formamidopyrimidine-DNA glycosylase [bacterium]